MKKSKQPQYLTYAGIGSRETPKEVLEDMTALATQLEELNFILRTGGATGADTAFLDGIVTNPGIVELYLPWKDYNGYDSPFSKVDPEAVRMASQFHPNWQACKQSVRKLHGRNCNIILGHDVLDPKPVEFVLCYTQGGLAKGGTGMAIALADAHLIPVFDFGIGVDYTLAKFSEFMEKNYL